MEADLVFLVDSSASVGADNFYNEIKFIRKLLADFTVSHNTTRLVVITYSSVSQVLKQVDHITRPDVSQHKCKLFEDEIVSITYNSGGTYTLGAVREAHEVLKYARPSAKKAVFLITDGYSNGGDPRPEAKKLKELGVQFFTFGIRNGNVKELYDMASEPREEHSYILDSFEEFEALARRALHKDLGGSVYLAQGDISSILIGRPPTMLRSHWSRVLKYFHALKGHLDSRQQSYAIKISSLPPNKGFEKRNTLY